MVNRKLQTGEYNFSFPMVGYHSTVDTVMVTLYLGNSIGLNQISGNDVTIIIKGYNEKKEVVGIESHFESVASDVVKWLVYYASFLLDPSRIDWYEVIDYYNKPLWKKVVMKWDQKLLRYQDDAEFQQMDPLVPNSLEG